MQSVAVASVVAAPPYSRAFVTQTLCLPSSFHSASLYLPARSLSLPLASATVRKPPCVLNGTSTLGGFLTLTQNDHGAHFNPNNLTPGVLGDESCYADDLGNLNANEASIIDNQIPLSGPNAVNGGAFVVDELDDNLGEGCHELSLAGGDAIGELAGIAAVPKKRTSKSKTRIRKNYWKRKGYQAALKALSLAKSLYSGKSKSFMTDKMKE